MEVFEIKKNSIRRQPSTSTSTRSVKRPYLLTIVGIILVTSGALVVVHFLLGYRNLKETLVIHRSVAENLRSPSCDDPFCNSKGCVKITSRLQELMRPEADPCVDFYEYSCGGYPSSSEFPSSQQSPTPADEAARNMLIDIRKLMERPPERNESQTLNKLKQLYNSCANTTQRDSDQKLSMLDWFTELNLSLEDSTAFTWRSLVTTLEEYGIHTIFKPSFKGSIAVPVEKIEVDCDVPLLAHNVYLEPENEKSRYILPLYRELIIKAVENLPDMDENKINDFVNNVLLMETDIARAFQESESTENGFSEEHTQEIKMFWRSVIGDSIQDVELISTCKHSLHSIVSLLDNAPAKVSTSYIVWRMLVQLHAHMGSGFRDNPHGDTMHPDLVPSYPAVWRQCAHLLRTEMGLPTFKALMDNGLIPAGTVQEIKESFNEAKRNFILTFRSVDWAGALTRKLFLSKINNMKLDIGYPETVEQPGVMDLIFNDLEIQDNYFQSVLNLKKFKTRHYFNRLWSRHLSNPITGISLESNPLGTSARYDYAENTVYLELGLMRFPLSQYTEDIPQYLKFGEISLLARHMSHAFDTTGCFYDGKGKMWDRTYWPETFTQKYDFFSNCLQTQLQNLTSLNDHGNETFNIIISDIGSFLVPYDGLVSHIRNFNDEKLLPSLSLTKKQIYYVRIAQTYCESKKSSKNRKNFMSSSRFRVNTAVSNMKDFGDVFNCPSRSILNPEVKCNIL